VKKVGDAPTLEIPANVAEFRRHIAEGLRRQGLPVPGDRSDLGRVVRNVANPGGPARPGKGLQGSRGDLAEYLDLALADASADRYQESMRLAVERHEHAAAAADARVQAMRALGAMPSAESAAEGAARMRVPDGYQPNRMPRVPVERDGWVPTQPAKPRPLRSAMWRLRDGIRPLQQPRVQACGRAIVAESGQVAVVVREDGSAALSGLAHCASVWECPACQMQILQARAGEISQAVERVGAERVGMLTLTIRHGLGDDLKQLRKRLANCYRAFTRHSRFKSWKLAHKLEGSIRAMEVTHGPNGWHPHLHVLCIMGEPLKLAWFQGDEGPRAVWDCPDRAELVALWQQCVGSVLGPEHVPSADPSIRELSAETGRKELAASWDARVAAASGDQHALRTTRCSDGEYIAKMGLELADPASKKARAGHRTPWQIASDWSQEREAISSSQATTEAKAELAAAHMKCRDASLWRIYCQDMRGARRLFWSHGLKARLDIGELTDADVAADDDEGPESTTTVIARILPKVWQQIRDRKLRGGETVPLYLLRCAERGGSAAVDRAVAEVATGRIWTRR